jgi:Mrp family chromosome partitioning ATPase
VPVLVVVIGPIASGKGTVAGALGDRFRQAGRAVALLDLDDVVDTVGGFVGLTTERFQQAQTVHGQLVGAWLDQGFDVIAHGPFFEPQEQEALLHAVPEGIELRRVLLLATHEVALERVVADPARKLSKHPGLLRRAYDRVESLLPTMPPSDWTFDTITTSWQAIVNELTAAILTERL